jgi:hypothetical protein
MCVTGRSRADRRGGRLTGAWRLRCLDLELRFKLAHACGEPIVRRMDRGDFVFVINAAMAADRAENMLQSDVLGKTERLRCAARRDWGQPTARKGAGMLI